MKTKKKLRSIYGKRVRIVIVLLCSDSLRYLIFDSTEKNPYQIAH